MIAEADADGRLALDAIGATLDTAALYGGFDFGAPDARA